MFRLVTQYFPSFRFNISSPDITIWSKFAQLASACCVRSRGSVYEWFTMFNYTESLIETRHLFDVHVIAKLGDSVHWPLSSLDLSAWGLFLCGLKIEASKCTPALSHQQPAALKPSRVEVGTFYVVVKTWEISSLMVLMKTVRFLVKMAHFLN